MVCLLHGTAHGAAGGRRRFGVFGGTSAGEMARRGDRTPRRFGDGSAHDVQHLRAAGGVRSIPLGYGSIPCSNARATPCWPKRSSNTNERASRSGCSQRLSIKAGSWALPRWVIVKAEAHAEGTNRRAVVTNRSKRTRVLPQAAYDEYANQGESLRTAMARRSSADWRPIV